MKTVSIYVPKKLLEELSAIGRELRRSRNSLILEAMEQLRDQHRRRRHAKREAEK